MLKEIIIAGPCAAESKEQIQASIKEAKKRNLRFLRISLWKPRTGPGFDGMGKEGINLLLQARKEGLIPATEVMTTEHAEIIIRAIPDSDVVLWIGSRNQNHFLQKEIANIASKNKKALLIIKNQPWRSEDHWLGIVEHIKKTKIKEKNILLCHRGFFPYGENPAHYRNFPDYEMAINVKKKSLLPMLIDPSHIGGSTRNVFKIIKEVKNYQFDGIMIEVHPDPQNALTDKNQQLSWKEFDEI